jgi:hypothetical protein
MSSSGSLPCPSRRANTESFNIPRWVASPSMSSSGSLPCPSRRANAESFDVPRWVASPSMSSAGSLPCRSRRANPSRSTSPAGSRHPRCRRRVRCLAALVAQTPSRSTSPAGSRHPRCRRRVRCLAALVAQTPSRSTSQGGSRHPRCRRRVRCLPLSSRWRRVVRHPKVGRVALDVVGGFFALLPSPRQRRDIVAIQGVPIVTPSIRLARRALPRRRQRARAHSPSKDGHYLPRTRRPARQLSAPARHQTGSISQPRRRTRPSSSSSRIACWSSGKGKALLSNRRSEVQLPRRPMI